MNPLTCIDAHPTGEWLPATVDQFLRIKRALPALRQRSFDEDGIRGWRLMLRDEPVAVWCASGAVNGVRIRVR